MEKDGPDRLLVYRLAWKWKMTGASGTGPWVRDLDMVHGLMTSLSERARERAEHWVEAAPAEARWFPADRPFQPEKVVRHEIHIDSPAA
jgi:hypothetical protein